MNIHTHARIGLATLVAVVVLAAVTPIVTAPATASPISALPTPDVAGNLLRNPGFEAPYGKQCCQSNLALYLPSTPIDEVQVAQGWAGWWREPDSSAEFPSRCDLPTSARICKVWHRPEWREAAPYANRIRTGTNAQKYFTFMSVHEAGMYQQVSGVRPGQRLEFSAYMSAWSTNENESLMSSGQQSMALKVGIDPTGGTNPFSSSIVWSAPGDSYDTFARFAVQAVAASSTVTVFTYSQPVYPLQHNDVYVDDAALVVVGTGSVSTTTTTTSSASLTTSSTSNFVQGPFPDTTLNRKTGEILYVVKDKDTLFSLAQRFNTTVSTLVSLNGFKSADLIRAGRTIIVGKVRR